MAKTRTPKEQNEDYIRLTEVLSGIGKLEHAPIEQMQYIIREYPAFIESIWQKGYAEGEKDGIEKGKVLRFNSGNNN